MAAAGRPVSEPHPLGGAVSLESTLFDSSKSSKPIVSPSGLAAEPGHTTQEERKEAFIELCKEHPTTPPRETDCTSLGVSKDPDEQEQSCTHSSVEMHTPSHHHELVVNAIREDRHPARPVQSTKPAPLPVHRSHSDTLPLVSLGTPPLGPDTHTCGLAHHGGEKSIQEAESHSMLACKLPKQLQPCNIITTISRVATRGDGGVLQALSRCACGSSPKAEAKVDDVGTKDPPHPKCDEALCCGSLVHHGTFEDTFAAYCLLQPIPAPSQVVPRQVESSCDLQCAGAPSLAVNHVMLPRLISSVSETGLDAKHLLRCCNTHCSWISALPPCAEPQSQEPFGLEESCSIQTATRDTGTMTAHKELKDVGVQTVTSLVFPQICMAEEGRSEASFAQTLNTDSDGGKKPGGAPKSPVKEVKWDAEGMTWEVYGASVDPEELGVAIQRHLELQIKETASRAAKVTRQNTNTSRQSRNNGCQRKRSRMMGSIQTPACCARSSTAVD